MFNIQNFSFQGPFFSINDLAQAPGIYVIFDKNNNGYFIVDVGESSNVRQRIENHDRKDCWVSKARGTVCCAVLYTPNHPEVLRRAIEQTIRDSYKKFNICGLR